MTGHPETRGRRLLAGLAVAVVTMLAGAVMTPAAADTESATQTWSVQPATEEGADGRAAWEYEVEPGEVVEDHAQVNNFGEQALMFRVYSHDAINAPGGAFTLQPADVEPAEVGAWIGLQTEVTIEPGASAVIPFTLTVPDDATPGDHAGGIVASVLSEGVDADGQQVVVDNRVGARIYLRVTGPVEPGLTVTGLEVGYERSWIPFTTGTAIVTYEVQNTGNVRLFGEQSVVGHGPFGLGQQRLVLEDLPEILPGQSVSVSTTIEGAAPLFRVVADVAVNPRVPATVPGADLVPVVQATASTGTWAVPWTELIIVALLLLWGLLSWRRRRREKRRTAAMLKEAVAKAREEGRREAKQETGTRA